MNPLLLDIPEHFSTQRLTLRAPRPGDGKIVNEAIKESFSSLNTWMNWARTIPSIDESEENVRRARAHFLLRDSLMFYMMDQDNRFLGTCSLVRMNWRVRCFEIGYWLRTSASGRGYMTEAVSGITEFAQNYLDANRIEIRCDTRNTASRGVAERSGYHLEAVLRKNFLDPVDQLQDDCLYAKIRLDDGTMGYPTD